MSGLMGAASRGDTDHEHTPRRFDPEPAPTPEEDDFDEEYKPS
ncbi:hypothetical protein [Nocardia arthritidis]|nr:hypothetical protein [Nocardia arthritidis]